MFAFDLNNIEVSIAKSWSNRIPQSKYLGLQSLLFMLLVTEFPKRHRNHHFYFKFGYNFQG